MSVRLVGHRLDFAPRVFALATDPPVRDALGLRDQSIEDTRTFIRAVIEEERRGESLSRVILNENDAVIGVTTLMHFNMSRTHCHLGTWIGYQYWGMGYNLESKHAILRIAFEQLHLDWVFLGARVVNTRSQRAQAKLPYISLDVGTKFVEERLALERRENQACVLNGVCRENFLAYLNR